MDILFAEHIASFKKQQDCNLPDSTITKQFVNQLFETLFVCKAQAEISEIEIQAHLEKIEAQLELILYPLLKSKTLSHHEAIIFFEALPYLYDFLLEDATAIFKADPAAKELNQVLVSYPGFFATAVYRFAHQLCLQKIPLLPRILSEYAHSKTGIDIHPSAIIGRAFAIDHGTGIVIGETTTIGDNVKIYQGVTLGALSVVKEMASEKRHPTVQDNVVIYSGATILGGQTTVGHDSIVGGNVWLTHSVDPFSVVYHKAEISVQDKKSYLEPYNFFI